jgi:hypothetical protein
MADVQEAARPEIYDWILAASAVKSVLVDLPD